MKLSTQRAEENLRTVGILRDYRSGAISHQRAKLLLQDAGVEEGRAESLLEDPDASLRLHGEIFSGRNAAEHRAQHAEKNPEWRGFGPYGISRS